MKHAIIAAVENQLHRGASAASRDTAAGSDEPLRPYRAHRAAVVREFEHGYLVRLMAQAAGNVSQAARLARMDRSHLIDLLYRHGLKS